MKKNKLSAVLATYNEEINIGACLESIKDLANEIVIIDGFSSDRTREIAGTFGARVFKVPNRLMFHKNKQLGLEKAKGDWILQLDADERVTKKLQEEILLVVNQPKRHLGGETCLPARQVCRHLRGGGSVISAFYIPRKNYFLGHWLKKGGQYPDYVIRLVKKGKAYFPCKTVHEQIKVEGETAYLENPLIHLASPSLQNYFKKANLYTSETALKFKKEKINKNLINFIYFLFIKPSFIFLNLFIRHKGFIDGIPGFLFAFFSSLHFPMAYIKFLRIK